MTDLNDLFKVIAEGKKQYEETDPVGKKLKEVKDNVKIDLGSLFSQLSELKENLEQELVKEEAKLTSLIDEDRIKQDARAIVNEVFGKAKPVITEEIPYQPVIHTPEVKAVQVEKDVDRYLTDKSFQQPEPDIVSKNVEDIRNKIKFLEQAIGRIAAAGPGGGEVNLRWLDDVDRSTITDGWYLRYSEAKKKFEFAEVIGGGGNGATGPAGATGPQGDTGGASGPQGLTGATGPSGVDGASGINGLDGATGPQGVDGASGIQGDQGASGVQGEQGASGINGVDGATGPQGIDGASGADSTVPGATGEVGATGIDGATGPQGIDGASGIQGVDGASGATGTNGIDGATGLQGASGVDGTNGLDGATGPQGEPGATGVDGASGVQGASGVDGTNGIDGATGPQGPDGASGADSTVPGATGLTGATGVGIDGSTGPQGIDGASGIQGDKGASGATGINGIDGATGLQGASGVNGASGIQGASGLTGLTGATGPQGIQGASGATGIQGASGVQGASGATGLTGATGATGIQGASGSTGLGATGLTGATGSPGVGGAVGYYGSFFDSQTRTASAESVGYPIPLDHLGEANGVSVQNNTRVTVAAAGTYNIQFSCELHNTGGGGPGTTVTIWLVKNGIALADTSTKINVNTNSPYVVPAWNFVLTLAANDYVELYWSTDNLNIVIEATGATGVQGATGFSPAIPSTIVTVQQIAYAITGATGVQGASGIQGASGATGIQGSSGVQGASGTIGVNGASGVQGASGSTGLTGATGSAGTNGSTGVQGASGSTGLTGATGNSVAASYLKYTRSAAQTSGLTAGSRIICNVSESTAGSDITIDTSTGAITLAAGKTYRLRGAVPSWTGGSRISFCWYNEATSAYIGEASQQYTANDAASYAASGGMAEAIITTASSTIVSFRIVSVGSALTQLGGNADFNTTGSYPWVDVEVISGNSPLLNGATGATGIQGASGSTGLTGATGPAPSVGAINWAQTLGASGFSGATGATGIVFSAAAFTGNGSPIEVTVCGDANPLAAGSWCRLQLYRDSTPIGTPIQAESSAANENIPYAFHVIDNPGAGTFTYALRATASAGGGFQFGEAGTSTITVKELSNVRGATGIQGASGVQGASGPNVSIPAWTSGGAITIGGTTTAPTKPTTRVQDNISYRQVGAKEWEVVLSYMQTSATGAANGSGDYLFTLPNSLSFDTTLPSQLQYTGNIGTSIWTLSRYILANSNGMIDNTATGGNAYPIIYSATQFRIYTVNATAWVKCFGSAHFQIADNSNMGLQLAFRFTST